MPGAQPSRLYNGRVNWYMFVKYLRTRSLIDSNSNILCALLIAITITSIVSSECYVRNYWIMDCLLPGNYYVDVIQSVRCGTAGHIDV